MKLRMLLPLALLLVITSIGLSQTYTSGDWTYTLNASNEATITRYNGTGGAVAIPSSLDGNPVKQLGDDEGRGYIFGPFNPSITSLTIPETVTRISAFALASCFRLTSVTIPESVTSIGEGAFYASMDLTSVAIPDSVTDIGAQAFLECEDLTSVTLGNGVITIGYEAFDGCLKLTSVTIPDSVTSIEFRAFAGCTTLSIGKTIENYSMMGFSAAFPVVSQVIIRDGVTSIGDHAFRGGASLASVTIPSSVTRIGSWAFQDCIGLTSITIPDSVTSIGGDAFLGCTGLTSVTIPSRFTSRIGAIGLTGQLATDLMADGLVEAIAQRVLAALPNNYGIATKDDVGIAVSNATTQTIAQVQAAPNDYNLHSAAEYQANYTTGVAAGTSLVTANPASYNLYTSDSIMDLRMGGAMVQKQGNNAVVTFQPQTTTDLTQPFTNNGTPITNTIPMPGNKGFLRIQAK
jgi:hypothetical protein